jgi:uncharacterized membrane protein
MSTVDIVARFIPHHVNTQHAESMTAGDKFALWIANKVGTLPFFWLCNALVITPLIAPSTMPVVQFVSSGYLQLVLLPLILIATNLQNRHDSLRADAHYAHEQALHTQLDLMQAQLNRMESATKGSTP